MEITETLEIPDEEISYSASRSSKPGGQNVNKLSTKITLEFDVHNSPSLTGEQKELIADRLSSRINKEGVLKISSQKFRSQSANREAAEEKFISLLKGALKKKRKRKKTKIPKAAKEKRLEEKKQRGKLKKTRSEKLL